MSKDRLLLSGALRPMRRRRGRRSRRATLTLAVLGLAALGFASAADTVPRLVWNASASAPVGLYWLSRTEPSRGDFVLAQLPPQVGQVAAERRYLPDGVPLVKRVAGLAGDVVCAVDRVITINGRPIAERLDHDRLGRPLPRWNGCRILTDNEVFLLMEGEPGSFDGRYFGPLGRAAIIGTLTSLWTE